MIRDAFFDTKDFAVEWILDGGGCEIGIDVGFVLMGWGVVRVFLKNAAGNYVNQVIKHATKSQKTDPMTQIL